VNVPVPVDRNRHAVVMSLVDGPNLNRCRLDEPARVLDEILVNVRSAYRAGIIHADLSEFNIMIERGRCVIIDWPQWMEAGHPNAQQVVQRDIENILAFFKRKYNITFRFEDALQCVTG
jgi:RIO kinase 2